MGKKLFSFWIVWPYDKPDKHDKSSSSNNEAEKTKNEKNQGEESEGEDDISVTREKSLKEVNYIAHDEL
jgi:hypothetical protein